MLFQILILYCYFVFHVRCSRVNIIDDYAPNGTVLVDGTCDGYQVKVKRIPIKNNDKDFHDMIHNHTHVMSHPNIVTIYGVQDDDKYHNVALEKCAFSLKDYLAFRPGSMSKPDIEPTTIFRYNLYKLFAFFFLLKKPT